MVITGDHLEPSPAQDILSNARQGDGQAFCRLMEPLQARLLRQAAALCGDLSAAEDLVSETLVEAWKSVARYNQTCRLSTWLYSILLHRYQKSVRRARARPISLAGLPFFEARKLHEQQLNVPAPGPSPAEAATQNEVAVHLRQCVELLPEKHRQIILLRFFEDAALPDIATVLGCSVGTVNSRLHHGLEKLRKMKMNLAEMKGDKTI